MFPPELRTMAIVPRWCIVATTLRDNVATHSYFVTVYSHSIAKTIGWNGPMEYLMLNALHHDNDETITSDITGPVKSIVASKEAEQFLYDKTSERMGALVSSFYDMEEDLTDEEIKGADAIVLAADKLDALLFLILNKRMGNTLVDPAIQGGMKSLEGAWRSLPAPKEVLDRTWQTVLLPAIDEHYKKGARGCAPGVNI